MFICYGGAGAQIKNIFLQLINIFFHHRIEIIYHIKVTFLPFDKRTKETLQRQQENWFSRAN